MASAAAVGDGGRHARLRFGLIGASDIAATRVLSALRPGGHDAVAVVSSSPERARSYAAANDIGWATTALEELLARDGVDAVYVSTTNELDHAQTPAAAGAGKHVLCEKPLPADRRNLFEVTVEAFAAAVAGDGRPLVDGADEPRALAVALAVQHAAERGRTAPVAWTGAADAVNRQGEPTCAR